MLDEKINNLVKQFIQKYGDKAVWQIDKSFEKFAQDIKNAVLERLIEVLQDHVS